MALLNYSTPYLAPPNPSLPHYYKPQLPYPPYSAPQGSYAYPTPQKPFLYEENSPYLQQRPSPALPQGQNRYQGQGQAQLHGRPQERPFQDHQPAFTKVTDEGTKTKVHAVIDYDYEEEEEEAELGRLPVTPIQGPIFLKNGSVPVVPLYSHPVLQNGTFVQIPILWTALSVALGLELRGEYIRGVPCIKRNQQLYCPTAGNSYPLDQIELFIDENKALMKRMYGEFDMPDYGSRYGPGAKRKRSTRPAEPDTQFDPGPNPVEGDRGAHFAKSRSPRQNFRNNQSSESGRKSSTKRCTNDCGCEQKYKWHRLLAYDPDNDCKGIFMDWFLFPSCCVCRCSPS